jgi:hypothetical protein
VLLRQLPRDLMAIIAIDIGKLILYQA